MAYLTEALQDMERRIKSPYGTVIEGESFFKIQ